MKILNKQKLNESLFEQVQNADVHMPLISHKFINFFLTASIFIMLLHFPSLNLNSFLYQIFPIRDVSCTFTSSVNHLIIDQKASSLTYIL